MSKNTLKFDNVEVNKKESHNSKQPIALNLVNVNQTLISAKYKHNDKGFKCFIGYKDDNIIRPLCIILPQMSEYIKYFDNVGKSMSFMIKDYSVLNKYNEIWDKNKKTLNIKFHSIPVYDEEYKNVKVKEFNSVINTNFWHDKVTEEGEHYTCIAISIDSVMKMEKKIYPQVYLEECKYRVKKKKMPGFIDIE